MTTPTNTDMRAALIEARDWFESQAKAVSKGCGSSYELHDLRTQRDALDEALASPAQAVAHDALRCMVGNCKFNGEVDKHATGCSAAAKTEEALLKALTEATRSLETIQLMAGKDDYLQDMAQVRAYATSRAMFANAAIAVFEDAPAQLAAPTQAVQGYTQQLIEALYENGDPVSVDAAEELQRLCAAPHAGAEDAIRDAIGFDFVPDELQTVNADDLLRVYEAGACAARGAAQVVECGNCFEGKSDMSHDCLKCGGSGAAQAALVEAAVQPDRTGIYAWVSGSSTAMVLVNKRPSNHAPGGQMNGHVIDSTRFYDGCPISQWGRDGRWTLLHDFDAARAAQGVRHE